MSGIIGCKGCAVANSLIWVGLNLKNIWLIKKKKVGWAIATCGSVDGPMWNGVNGKTPVCYENGCGFVFVAKYHSLLIKE